MPSLWVLSAFDLIRGRRRERMQSPMCVARWRGGRGGTTCAGPGPLCPGSALLTTLGDIPRGPTPLTACPLLSCHWAQPVGGPEGRRRAEGREKPGCFSPSLDLGCALVRGCVSSVAPASPDRGETPVLPILWGDPGPRPEKHHPSLCH